jgi:hypothetical protein
MLIGVVLFELFFIIVYVLAACGIYVGGPIEYANFWSEAFPTFWFWEDFLSELVILVGAVWLLRRGKS